MTSSPPDDEPDPWSLSLVARVERDAPGRRRPTHTDVLVAAARAVVLLLDDPRVTDPDGELHAAVQAWRDRRIRKICRRARGAAWDRTAALPHSEAGSGDAVVRVFAPHPREEVPDLLRPCRSAGSTSTTRGPRRPRTRRVLTVRLTPGVAMTTGKAAAQVGHAAQLPFERLPHTDAWRRGGFGVRVVTGPVVLPPADRVDVRDGGFTEVAPGTVTASAGFEGTV